MSDSTIIKRGLAAGAASRKVLFVTGRLAPTGPCRAIVALARRLKQNGCAVTIACRSGSIASVYPGDRRGSAGTFDPPVWLSRALGRNLHAFLNLRGLVRRVRDMDPDLLHVYGASLAGVGARLARRLRKPYVLALDDLPDPGQSLSLSRRFISRVIVGSDARRVDLVNRFRLPRGVVEIVPDGVEIDASPGRKPGLKGFGIPVVGTMGRLVESQGQEHFILAAHALASRGRDMHFVIAGEGPDRKRLRNLVWQLGLAGRVTFARSPVDELAVLRAIDIMVIPALTESLGLPVIEAMAAGIPVIATSAGGIFRVVENRKTGILVPKKDPEALAREIENLTGHPDMAADLAARARDAVVRNANIDATAHRMAQIYDAILSARPSPVRDAAAGGASSP